MSSNKTVIPGMESSYEPTQELRGQQSFGSETFVPGNIQTPAGSKMTEKPIVGFLYSVSRTPSGEFWPLHIGSNTIGRSSECDFRIWSNRLSINHERIAVRAIEYRSGLDELSITRSEWRMEKRRTDAWRRKREMVQII